MHDQASQKRLSTAYQKLDLKCRHEGTRARRLAVPLTAQDFLLETCGVCYCFYHCSQIIGSASAEYARYHDAKSSNCVVEAKFTTERRQKSRVCYCEQVSDLDYSTKEQVPSSQICEMVLHLQAPFSILSPARKASTGNLQTIHMQARTISSADTADKL